MKTMKFLKFWILMKVFIMLRLRRNVHNSYTATEKNSSILLIRVIVCSKSDTFYINT